MRLLVFIAIFCISIPKLFGQCNVADNVFQPEEKVDYLISYKLGSIWVSAGKVSFLTHKTEYRGKDCWFFESSGISLPRFDWFFRVRDTFKAYIDVNTFIPDYAERVSDEGGYIVIEQYNYDKFNNKIISRVYSSGKPWKIDTFKYCPCINDVLTAIYVARNKDFSTVKPQEKIPLQTLVFGKIQPLYIRYIGPEIVKLRNGQKFNCLKFSSKLVEGTIFKGGEDMFVWVTNDKNHMAIKIQAKIVIGSVVAEMTGFKNNKYPLTSLQK